MAHTEDRKKRERVRICMAKIGKDCLRGKDCFMNVDVQRRTFVFESGTKKENVERFSQLKNAMKQSRSWCI